MKIFYTVHGFAHQWNTGKPKDILLERLERVLAHRTDVMFFQSSEDLENAKIRHYKTDLEFLSNGVGDEWFALPLAPPRKGRLKALFVGRLVEEKGIIDLLDALANVPEVELTVVGSQLPSDRGGVAEQVARLVDREPLRGRVRCTGRMSQDQLRAQMLSTDVVVLPSYREGVPRSLIEGMAAGRPLLATDTRGCRELITEDVNGFLVPVARPDLLAQTLQKFVKLSSAKFATMGMASKNRALAYHREEIIFDRLAATYIREGIFPLSV
jgi:glycosyltransferase involved in cell wall biosynthesis